MTPFYCNVNEAMNNQTEGDEIQHQGEEQQRDDQQLLHLQSSKPQMEEGSILPKEQVITNDERSGGKGDNKGPNPEQNRSGHASGCQGHMDGHGRGGTYGTVEHRSNEKPGNDIPTLYDGSYSDEEDDKTVHPEQVITNDERSGGKGDNKGPNPEQNRSGHASGYQGHMDGHGRGGTSGTVEHRKNEKPGNDIPTSYDASYSDEEDDKTVVHPEFEFFWLKNNPFSQWYRRHFFVEPHHFVTAEQFMMYQKAVTFNDSETAEKILKERNPRKQQKLGRQARNFNPQKWKEVCLEIVKKANFHKFSQNEDLKNHLFSTYPKILVEASPYDRIWGIGRAARDPKARNKETWLGHNLLGYALTDVRNEMMIKEKIIPAGAPTFLAESAIIDIENFDSIERFV